MIAPGLSLLMIGAQIVTRHWGALRLSCTYHDRSTTVGRLDGIGFSLARTNGS